MGLTKKRLAEALVPAAMRFADREIWERIADNEPVALRLPGRDGLVVASIMGASEITFGLTLFTGDDALQQVMGILLSDDGGHERMLDADQVTVTFDPLSDLTPRERRFLDLAGFAGRRESLAPRFSARPRAERPRPPDLRELEVLLLALNGLLLADDRGQLEPLPAKAGGEVLTLEVTGDPRRPEIAVGSTTAPSGFAPPERSPAAAPDGLADLPRRPVRWVAGFPLLPATVAGDQRALHSLLVAEWRGEGETAELVPICAHALPSTDLDAAAGRFFDLLTGRSELSVPGRPEEVVFASRALHGLLAPALATVDVTCRYDPDNAEFEDLAESLRDHLAPGRGPASDDLAALKRLEQEVSALVGREVEGRGLITRESARLYLGPCRSVDEVYEKMRPLGIDVAFVDWLFFDHIPPRAERTIAGEILRQKLTGAERRMLRAMDAAKPVVYEVVASHPEAGFLEIRPAGGGQTVTLNDRGLSASAKPGWHMVLKVYPAGDFHFCTIAGPPMNPLRAIKAMASLEAPPAGRGRRRMRSRHTFGHLWTFIAEGPPDLIHYPAIRNTEGSELRFHEAAFEMADEGAVREALTARADVEPLDRESEFGWLGPEQGSRAGLGRTSLGRIRLLPGELLLEVNSRERFEAARTWLLAIPGVTLRDVRVRTLTELSEEKPPLDDLLADPRPDLPPAEAEVAIQTFLYAHCMQWLDEKIPALGGKTPREACRTPKGRERVRELIENWPIPGAPEGVVLEIPKREMLRELRLED